MISQFSASKFLTEFMQPVDKINVQYHPGFESDRLVCATFHLTGSTIARDHVFTQNKMLTDRLGRTRLVSLSIESIHLRSNGKIIALRIKN